MSETGIPSAGRTSGTGTPDFPIGVAVLPVQPDDLAFTWDEMRRGRTGSAKVYAPAEGHREQRPVPAWPRYRSRAADTKRLSAFSPREQAPSSPCLHRVRLAASGAKALSKAIRNTFGRHTPIQRCQVHKARNITERLAKPLHASVRKALRQAWELDDADKAERLIKNLARRLEHDAPGVAASILEGLDEILTVTRLGLPVELRRSLACTNIIENIRCGMYTQSPSKNWY